MKFRAIVGALTPIKVNVRIRELCAAVTELQEAAGLSDDATETVTVAAEDQPVTSNTSESADEAASQAQEDEGAPEADQPFNWRESNSVKALKAFALETLGLTIRKQKVDTIKAEIASFVELDVRG